MLLGVCKKTDRTANRTGPNRKLGSKRTNRTVWLGSDVGKRFEIRFGGANRTVWFELDRTVILFNFYF